MIDSLYIAATGIGAQQTRLDALSNNVANVNTYAYKKQRANFEDVFYRQAAAASGLSAPAALPAPVGLGVAVSRTQTVFTPGDLAQTKNPLDLAIQGDGFFEVQLGDGSTAYTRLGSLRLDEHGELVTQDGDPLKARFVVPSDATSVVVASNGQVSATVAGQDKPVVLGSLELANFVNPNGLKPLGAGLYAATDESGPAFVGTPGQQGLGTLNQGYLEASNVDLNSELVDLVLAQQAYQLNSRVIQISDDILSTITTFRRS
ncbi:MAG TPA: flagellar basal-body rod protein FlgG [Nevskia sp.]|nr:flagellar basal-body rod protein FlgG [Nevskia sp.]